MSSMNLDGSAAQPFSKNGAQRPEVGLHSKVWSTPRTVKKEVNEICRWWPQALQDKSYLVLVAMVSGHRCLIFPGMQDKVGESFLQHLLTLPAGSLSFLYQLSYIYVFPACHVVKLLRFCWIFPASIRGKGVE